MSTQLVGQAEEELVRRFIEALESQRRQLVDALRDSWSDVEESNFIASATTLTLKPQSDNEFRVDFVLAYAGVASPANGGLITLGDADRPHQIPIQGGVPVGFDCKIRLKNTSTRRIDTVVMTTNSPGLPPAGPAGFLYLALFGKEVPLGAIKW